MPANEELVVARQAKALLGRVNYFTDQQTRELLALKKRLGYDDVRFRDEDCQACGDSSFDESYSDFVPEPYAFRRDALPGSGCNGQARPSDLNMADLVRLITDQVMAALAGAGV